MQTEKAAFELINNRYAIMSEIKAVTESIRKMPIACENELRNSKSHLRIYYDGKYSAEEFYDENFHNEIRRENLNNVMLCEYCKTVHQLVLKRKELKAALRKVHLKMSFLARRGLCKHNHKTNS